MSTNHCTSEFGSSQSKTKGTSLPNIGAVCCNSFTLNDFTFRDFSSFLLLVVITLTFNLKACIFSFRCFTINGPLPLLLWLVVMVLHLNLHIVALFPLLQPALRLIPTLFGVLRVAGLFIFSSTNFRVFRRALLRRLSVASFTWLVPTLLRIFGFAFFAELVVALLIMFCVALLMVRRLAQFFIFGLALCVVLCLAGGAELSRALVLVLFHTHLFLVSFAVRGCDILPFHMAFRFLELFLKVFLQLVDPGVYMILELMDMGKEPHACWSHQTHCDD